MVQKLPLRALWKSLGAEFRESSGWELPSRFAHPIREHEAVPSSAGLLDLSHYGKIEVRGEDRVAFLHNLLTQDIKRLEIGALTMAALLTAQGRLVGLMNVVRFEDRILLLTEALLTQKLIAALERYVIMEQVELQDRSGDYCLLSVEGPSASLMPPTVTFTQGERDVQIWKISGRMSETGQDGMQILSSLTKAHTLVEELLKAREKTKLQPVGQEALEILRIEAGIPRFGIDYDESTLFPELGLEEAVSHTKGCYVGQEIVARIDSFGGLAKKLVGLEIEGGSVPAPGTALFHEGERVGRITSAVLSPALKKPIALAYVNREHYGVGTLLEIQQAGTTGSGRIVPLKRGSDPFF